MELSFVAFKSFIFYSVEGRMEVFRSKAVGIVRWVRDCGFEGGRV